MTRVSDARCRGGGDSGAGGPDGTVAVLGLPCPAIAALRPWDIEPACRDLPPPPPLPRSPPQVTPPPTGRSPRPRARSAHGALVQRRVGFWPGHVTPWAMRGRGEADRLGRPKLEVSGITEVDALNLK